MKTTLLTTALLVATSIYAKPIAPIAKEELQTMNFFKNKGISVLGTALVENTDLTVVSFLAQTPQGEQRMSAFVPKGKQYVIVGGGYKDKTGEQVVVPINMSTYKKDAAFTVGSGKKELYIFTDPECPYCMKMDKELLAKLPKNEYTAHVYMFPLSFHRYAESAAYFLLSKKNNQEKADLLHLFSGGFSADVVKQMSEYDISAYRMEQQSAESEIRQIVSQGEANGAGLKSEDYMRIGALKQIIAEADNKVVKKVGKPLVDALKKEMEVAKALGVSGTPTVFDASGAPMNWMALLQQQDRLPASHQ